MDRQSILNMVDHTLLLQTSTWEQIKKICDQAMENKTASACIPPSFVKQVKEYVGDRLAVCTVIGFPNGYNTTNTKVFETKDATENGADEIDMVVNLTMVKDKKYSEIQEEIARIKHACGDKVLKVIIETCFLTEEEKVEMCKVVTNAKADFIKTSTGFGTNGATLEDIILMKNNVGKEVKIKAAGGVKSLKDAEDFIENGASRIGTSRLISDKSDSSY